MQQLPILFLQQLGIKNNMKQAEYVPQLNVLQKMIKYNKEVCCKHSLVPKYDEFGRDIKDALVKLGFNVTIPDMSKITFLINKNPDEFKYQSPAYCELSEIKTELVTIDKIKTPSTSCSFESVNLCSGRKRNRNSCDQITCDVHKKTNEFYQLSVRGTGSSWSRMINRFWSSSSVEVSQDWYLQADEHPESFSVKRKELGEQELVGCFIKIYADKCYCVTTISKIPMSNDPEAEIDVLQALARLDRQLPSSKERIIAKMIIDHYSRETPERYQLQLRTMNQGQFLCETDGEKKLYENICDMMRFIDQTKEMEDGIPGWMKILIVKK